jgi:sterol desaturase/sphingolipid hydroxylase (fatty acid hydroxylase superfamily)
VEGHCGFALPFSPFRSLPLGSGPAAHIRHHEQPDANFASLLAVWDWLCATDYDSRQRQRRKYSRDKINVGQQRQQSQQQQN